MNDLDTTPTLLGVPLNRILTIARGPINMAAGTIATWLLVHVHLLGLFHLQSDGLSTAIAQGFVFLLTAVLTDRGIAQWVRGHHIELGSKNAAMLAEFETLLQHYLKNEGDPEKQSTVSSIGEGGPITPRAPGA